MRFALFSSLMVCLASLSSCIFVAEDEPTPAPRDEYTGQLIIDWTINGTTDPDECDQGDASWLRISVFTSSGSRVADYQDSCDAFSTSVELDPGSYYADAVLEDVDGRARTTPVAIDDFTIQGRDQLAVPVEFPASSFY